MAVDAVIDIVKAAADASGQTISHGLVRMLTKLSAHAEPATSRRGRPPTPRCASRCRQPAERVGAGRSQPGRLRQAAAVPGHDVGRAPAEPARRRGETGPRRCGWCRCSSRSATPGPLVDRAVDQRRASRAGGAQPLVALLDQAPEGSTAAAERLLVARLTQPLAIAPSRSREPLDELREPRLPDAVAANRRLRDAARRAGLVGGAV